MRIVIIHTFYYPEIMGGAEYSVKILAEQLVKRGNKVDVICTGIRQIDETINGVDVHRCTRISCNNRLLRKVIHGVGEYYSIPMNRSIEKHLKILRPDVVYTNCLYEFSQSVWMAAHKLSIPVIHTPRDFYPLCKKVHMQCSGCRYPRFLCRISKTLYKKMSRYVSAVVVASESVYNTFKAEKVFINIPHFIIPNVIPFDIAAVLDNITRRLQGAIPLIPFRFAYLGALGKHKGINWLLDVFRGMENENLELHIAGKGELLDMVETAASQDPRIVYHGFLEESKVIQLLMTCNALICPSIWSEPFGRVILDAYKQGLPVIATRSGGLVDLVNDKETGILIDPSDSNALKAAMLEMAYDEIKYKNYLAGIASKLHEYSSDVQAESFELLFTSVIRSYRLTHPQGRTCTKMINGEKDS